MMQSSLSQKTEELMMSYKTSLDLLGIPPGHFTAEDFLMIRRQAMSEMMSAGQAYSLIDNNIEKFSTPYRKEEKREKDKKDKKEIKNDTPADMTNNWPSAKAKQSILFETEEEKEDLLSLISG